MTKRSDTGECHAGASFEKRAPETATAGGADPGDPGADGVPPAAVGEPAGLAALLNALTVAAETGRGYLRARAAVVAYVSATRASALAVAAGYALRDMHSISCDGDRAYGDRQFVDQASRLSHEGRTAPELRQRIAEAERALAERK